MAKNVFHFSILSITPSMSCTQVVLLLLACASFNCNDLLASFATVDLLFGFGVV